MSELSIRKATETDHQAVVAINQDVYLGYDYIPYNYQVLIRDKRIHAYIGEENGKAITFLQYAVLNNGKTCLSGAARTSKEAQGKGINSQVGQFASEELKKLYPSLKREVWLVVWNDYHEKTEKLRDPPRVKLAWHFNLFATTKENISKSQILRNHERRTKELDHTSSLAVLKNPKNQNLFERVPLIAYHWWTPIYVVDDVQLEEYCLRNKIFASECTLMFEVSALSSSMPVLSPNGIITSIFFHSVPSSDELFVDHILSHLEHLSSVAEDANRISFTLHFPLDIDVQKVTDFLKPDFGEPSFVISKYSKVAMFETDF